ncbi:hypothetical protein [Aquibacillus salsiterrae]|uniref:Inner spore coat protein n=1 Tax=Aquibacillus salsiterrae TaxID=2950439 RepID=A0A9X3WFZ1_9BACI|nr:hypothetical protein [Aquibacillus salsiterrae]MDC3418303.1 hypothetical protein [Aquibacillus salsiterrae]
MYQQHNHFPYYSLNRAPSFPEVDTSLFQQSASKSHTLISQANKIVEKITSSNSFAFSVMDAAQKSETNKVKQLLKEIGIDQTVDVIYNPDGIKITIQTNEQNQAKVSLSLRWR